MPVLGLMGREYTGVGHRMGASRIMRMHGMLQKRHMANTLSSISKVVIQATAVPAGRTDPYAWLIGSASHVLNGR